MNVFENIGKEKRENYILPFMWLSGESHGEILHELHIIYECGIREICLESRTHPDFVGRKWWADLDILVEEAKRLGMRLWILDDDHFPTGHANGRFEKQDVRLQKVYLAEKHADFIAEGNQVFYVRGQLEADAEILSLLAVPRKNFNTGEAFSLKESIDLTSCIDGDFAFFSLPGQGIYRVFVLYKTQTGGGREHYMNLIDADSVQVLIDEVYESHFRRYKKEFGKTIAGFFSDEPQLGNVCGYDFGERLGREGHKVPWSKELEYCLKKRWKKEFNQNLLLLWYEDSEKTAAVRIAYMDELTKLVHQCFSGKLGAWCRERGVEYIGHIIEDNQADMYLGCSIGHYFREMKGQAMAGIDVVHHQIVPGHTQKKHQWAAWDGDGEFFHFVLAKLATSSARYDKEKCGRSLCEIFGNYGWGMELYHMKWLTDHMLVNGINHFVPHAFSVKDPNPDCPPHFYAGGNNPQFSLFKELMKYMNRLCELFSHGTAVTDIAVLYNAESVWSGRRYSSIVQICRILAESQILFDLLPEDFTDEAKFSSENGFLEISGNTYKALIIPGCEVLSARVMQFLNKIADDSHFRVYIVGEEPVEDSFGQHLNLKEHSKIYLCEEKTLEFLLGRYRRIAFLQEKKFPNLRMYHYIKQEETILFFFNEDIYDTVFTEVKMQGWEGECILQYDALRDETFFQKTQKGKIWLTLKPGQTAILQLCKNLDISGKCLQETEEIVLNGEFKIAAIDEKNRMIPVETVQKGGEFPDMYCLPEIRSWANEYVYRSWFAVTLEMGKEIYIKLPICYNGAIIVVNGTEVGRILSSRERLFIGNYVSQGGNLLEIRIPNLLIWKRQDPMSFFSQIHIGGLGERPILEFIPQK